MSVAQVSPSHVALQESPSGPRPALREVSLVGPQPPRLLDRVRQALQTRHRSRRTEKAYVMIYTHVLNRGPAAVRSPADRMLGA